VQFIADENIDTNIVRQLTEEGYSILSIAEDFPGISDIAVLELVNTHQAILLTGDKDFGELVFHRRKTAQGVVLIRIFGIPEIEKAHIVVEVFKQYAADFDKSFTVIGRNKIRIKKMD
jgi:predicted nuclease of predicted toxin-antitoxin system